MPNPINVPITPPRVAFIDPRSNTVSREWYLFFLSLFQSQGGSSISLDDVQKGPPTLTVDEINHIVNKASENLAPSQDGLLAQIAELQKEVLGLQSAPSQNDLLAQIAELQKEIQALQVAPQFDVGVVTAAIAGLSSAPATKTADFTVADNETWLINNKSGSTCTATLPSASSYTGRVLHFQNYQAQTLVSASSNVVPLAGGSATTAILQAVAGANATLVSDGTNWIMTQYDSNNSLELE
jgi:hypothetical protein